MITAAESVSFSVERGSVLALRGESGSGKTTVLMCAGALLSPNGGTVSIEGTSVNGLSVRQRNMLRATKIGFVFQQFNLIPYLTVQENVALPSLARRGNNGQSAKALLEQFGLGDRARHLPRALSTGECQRAALARALFNGPSLVCADEPTGNLDDANAALVLEHLRRFANNGGAVLLVSHDSRTAKISDKTLVMNHGKVSDGSAN
jgi:putative ABC transport system ATP-binding protein